MRPRQDMNKQQQHNLSNDGGCSGGSNFQLFAADEDVTNTARLACRRPFASKMVGDTNLKFAANDAMNEQCQ